MGREKKKCVIEGCGNMGKSLGRRSGKSHYSPLCGKHRNENKRNNKLKKLNEPQEKTKNGEENDDLGRKGNKGLQNITVPKHSVERTKGNESVQGTSKKRKS